MPSSDRIHAKPIIGLLGGPGSGKSFVARLFADEGCGVIDADRLARDALTDPQVVSRIRERFGEQVIDEQGGVDRPALARVVFNDEQARGDLQQWIHPKVGDGRAELRRQYAADASIRAIVEDSPLLLEAGLAEQVDRLVFVDAPWALRVERVAERGWDEEELARRENSQMPLDSKRQRADDVVVNSGDAVETARQVRRLLTRYLHDAR